MITLMLLAVGRGPTLGPWNQGWTSTVLVIFLVVIVAGIVAIWNRSRYRP